jgi:hypothetical protein
MHISTWHYICTSPVSLFADSYRTHLGLLDAVRLKTERKRSTAKFLFELQREKKTAAEADGAELTAAKSWLYWLSPIFIPADKSLIGIRNTANGESHLRDSRDALQRANTMATRLTLTESMGALHLNRLSILDRLNQP